MNKQPAIFFACDRGYLDPYTLSYRWFGAVWILNDQSEQMVIGYWFGDGREEIVAQAKASGWHSFFEMCNKECLQSIYQSFRSEQQTADWSKRSCLGIKDLLSTSWRTAKSGWYILRSREQYPLYLSAFHKKGWFVFLRHVAVCETEADAQNCIGRINREHNIKLRELHPREDIWQARRL